PPPLSSMTCQRNLTSFIPCILLCMVSGFALVVPHFATPSGVPTPRHVEASAVRGMGALAPLPVIELTGKLQKHPSRFSVRGVCRPGRTPVGIFQDRVSGFSPAVQVADDPHRGAAGGKKDLVLLRLHGLTGPPPTGPHRDF